MKSFRLRIILWTTIIAGAVMLGFGVAGNIAFEKMKLRQVDESLSLFVARLPFPPNHKWFWDRAGEDVRQELERHLGSDAMVASYGTRNIVEEGEDPVLLTSKGDFEALFPDQSSLPATNGYLEMEPEGPGPEGGPPRGKSRRNGAPLGRPEFSSTFVESSVDGERWRVSVATYPGFNVLTAVNYEKIRRDTALMRSSFAVAFPIALLAMAASIWFFVTRAIRPVARLSTAIEKVSAKSLNARLENEGAYSEFASLIDHFNLMLQRLDRSFTQATRFSADAAHELKTPLAILQGQLEVALQEADDDSKQQRLLGGLLEETHRLKSITRKLLILAKADAGSLETQLERVDLRSLTEDLVELASEDDPGANIRLEYEKGIDYTAKCDETLTRQILNNLIGNSLKYRIPQGSEVLIELQREEGSLRVEVSNRCEALGADIRSRLFDRFIRADNSRSRSEDGTGLGLSLSLEFAKAQGGQLSLVEGTEENELKVRFELPSS
ncbi:sensor histidine kinase [Pelagicoccus albus]|uniref:histidine kinase n=1 Tax=Pelagicoccus albus TaxID=415222 RepID=A0A7X1B4D4_9BACT|nr:ATP-binding protein [Pelagicoccus albus]MBC2605395.1 HAMP domain-containing protein [Pelagicoccus albus]